MSDERNTVVGLEDVDGFAEEGRPQWHMIRSTLGVGSFGINAWRATAPGQGRPFAQTAQDDPDLASIRDRPDFPAAPEA